MTSVKNSLEKIGSVDGFVAAAVVDFESGLTLGTLTSSEKFDIELAASGNTQVVRAKMSVMNSLGIEGSIEDILITLGDQYHLIRPLRNVGTIFLYLAIDRKKGNLGMARHQLTQVEKDLTL